LKEQETEEAQNAYVTLKGEINQLEQDKGRLEMTIFDHEQTIICREAEIDRLKQMHEIPKENKSIRCDLCLGEISMKRNWSEAVFFVNREEAFTKHYCEECDCHEMKTARMIMNWYNKDNYLHEPELYQHRLVFKLYYGTKTSRMYTLAQLEEIEHPKSESESEPEEEPEEPTRKRKAYDSDTEVIQPPQKRRHVRVNTYPYNTVAYDQCPWCEFRGDKMKRSLMEHICGRTCSVPFLDRVHTDVKHTTSFAHVGDSGFEALQKLGFDDPHDFKNEYIEKLGGHCTHCSFKCVQKRKLSRHVKYKHPTV
jgi:hypothetical protein